MTDNLKSKPCAYHKRKVRDMYLEKGHSCLRHYTCRSCGEVHVRKGK